MSAPTGPTPQNSGAIKPVVAGKPVIMKPLIPTGPSAMGVKKPSSRLTDKSAMLRKALHDFRKGLLK